jgi:hypothetical protein
MVCFLCAVLINSETDVTLLAWAQELQDDYSLKMDELMSNHLRENKDFYDFVESFHPGWRALTKAIPTENLLAQLEIYETKLGLSEAEKSLVQAAYKHHLKEDNGKAMKPHELFEYWQAYKQDPNLLVGSSRGLRRGTVLFKRKPFFFHIK